jgi:hypothetical protein
MAPTVDIRGVQELLDRGAQLVEVLPRDELASQLRRRGAVTAILTTPEGLSLALCAGTSAQLIGPQRPATTVIVRP